MAINQRIVYIICALSCTKTDCIEITMQQILFWIKTSLWKANKMKERFDKPKTLNVRGKLGPFVKVVCQMQMYNN